MKQNSFIDNNIKQMYGLKGTSGQMVPVYLSDWSFRGKEFSKFKI